MKPLFIAATRQHVGKTTCSLAILSGLTQKFDRVGFIKPVGQQHVAVDGSDVRVDKDVQLMKEYFGMEHVAYEDMSPVIVPRNYTKQYVDGGGSLLAEQKAKILAATARVEAASEATVLEGTGHVGVGSIIGASNADVAAWVGADVVLVANGGIGSAFDELEMNRIMLKDKGVRVRGVILNKVRPDKVDMIRDYVGRALRDRWGCPLLGVVPDLPFLGKATLDNYEKLLEAEFISGQRHRDLHYGASDLACVTTAVRRFLRKANYRETERKDMRPLFITHCTRDDVLLAFLAYYKRSTRGLDVEHITESDWLGAMVLCTGECEITDPAFQNEDNTSLPYLMEIARAYDAPIMVTKMGTVEATNDMANFTAKMHIGDRERIKAAIDHYQPHIDFDALLAG